MTESSSGGVERGTPPSGRSEDAGRGRRPAIDNGAQLTVPEAPIAVGRTAEVFAWGDGRILKLYRPEMPEVLCRAEVAAADVVAEAGLATPRCLETLLIQGRLGAVYERVEGRSMLETFAGRPWTVGRMARQFAALHLAMHEAPGAGLPSSTARFERMIERAADLPDDLRESALARLGLLPVGHAVLHGDLHPGNVLMGASGPTVIDWMTATCGNPTADVVRTLYLLREAAVPGSSGGPRAVATGLVRRWFAGVYLRSYLRVRKVDRAELLAWRPVILAARLGEGIEEERDHLLLSLRQACSQPSRR